MKFKNHIYKIALLTFLLAGCNSQFLNKAPLDSINTANFFQTESDAIAAINGAYQPLQWPKLYNMRMWTTDIMAGNSETGGAGGTDGIETKNEANFVTKPTNPGVLDLWRGPWPGILRCNTVLEKVPGMTNIPPALKNRILGEAHFLRGLYYFILVRFFGAVPMITKPQKPGDNLRPIRTPVSDIYNKVIIPDLTEAIKLLPLKSSYTGNDVGRAAKGSATGLLAKVYLTIANMQKFAGKNYAKQNTTADYQKVVTLCNQVTQLGYKLDANYADNFNPNYENDQECLFSVQYYGKTSYSFWSNENQSSWTSTFMGPRNSNMVAGGYGWDQPTKEFVNSYEPGDKRKAITILYKGCPDFDGMAYNPSWSNTGFNVRKFLVPKSIAPTYDSSPLNFPVLRYADVLLMQAEALNELGQTTTSEGPLNEVRARAGLPPVQGLNQTNMRLKILHERRMELAFEGQRWFDLITHPKYALQFLHSIGKTNATIDNFLLPIPQKAIDSNPNLTQNPGY